MRLRDSSKGRRTGIAGSGPHVPTRPVGLAMALLAALAATARADGPYELAWFTLDGGGATRSAGVQYALGGTIGQPDAGMSSGATLALKGGFWCGGATVSAVDDGSTAPDGAPPLVFRLYDGAPNPFNPSTRIAFDLPRGALVRLRVYDLRGGLVRTLVEATMPAGHHAVTWDGSDQSGAPVASGGYVFVIDTGDDQARRKCLLLK